MYQRIMSGEYTADYGESNNFVFKIMEISGLVNPLIEYP